MCLLRWARLLLRDRERRPRRFSFDFDLLLLRRSAEVWEEPTADKLVLIDGDQDREAR